VKQGLKIVSQAWQKMALSCYIGRFLKGGSKKEVPQMWVGAIALGAHDAGLSETNQMSVPFMSSDIDKVEYVVQSLYKPISLYLEEKGLNPYEKRDQTNTDKEKKRNGFNTDAGNLAKSNSEGGSHEKLVGAAEEILNAGQVVCDACSRLALWEIAENKRKLSLTSTCTCTCACTCTSTRVRIYLFSAI